jgi:hypothetical protein
LFISHRRFPLNSWPLFKRGSSILCDLAAKSLRSPPTNAARGCNEWWMPYLADLIGNINNLYTTGILLDIFHSAWTMAVLDILDSYFNLTIARNITLREIVLAIVAVYTISIVVEGIRRVWFHPLSKYPGPRLAALTLWWQCYYDVFLNSGGQLLAHLEPLHEKYGMCLYILSE